MNIFEWQFHMLTFGQCGRERRRESRMPNEFDLIKELLEALELNQFGFSHRRCSICAGWDMGPNGETDNIHTKDCPIALAIKKAKRYVSDQEYRVNL